MEDCNQKYSCRTAKETLEWINAILNFIKPFAFLTNAHVTNFFTHKLWQSIDPVWLHCLRNEPVQNLLLIPCGALACFAEGICFRFEVSSVSSRASAFKQAIPGSECGFA